MATFNPMSALSTGVSGGPDAMGMNVHHQSGQPMMDPFDQDLGFDDSIL